MQTPSGAGDCRGPTCDGARGGTSVQGHIRMRGDVAMENRDLLAFGNPVLDGIRLAWRSHPGLLGKGWAGGQMRWSDLLCHQLLLDFIDQD